MTGIHPESDAPVSVQTAEAPLAPVRTSSLDALKAVSIAIDPTCFLGLLATREARLFLEYAKGFEHMSAPRIRKICFVAPLMPHTCELEIWNLVTAELGCEGVLLTRDSELRQFEFFAQTCAQRGVKCVLTCRGLEGIAENRTFLSGLEQELHEAVVIVSVGESSLSTFQALKASRVLQSRLVVWQNSSRPLPATLGTRNAQGLPLPEVTRERAVRQEILKNCDLLVCFDKESATWAFLENVHAQRIRRVPRGVDLERFSSEFALQTRLDMRASLQLPEADFIFLQLGPLEIESGAIDTVYAFKTLLQSNPELRGTTKLAFCGTGSAGPDVRQAVVDLQMDMDVFFINPNDRNTRQILGNQLTNLLGLCDAVIHNPVAPVSNAPGRYLDSTYDVLCALASGLTVVSNGHGWVGDFLARFFKVFAPCNIHGQAKLMRESMERQDRLHGVKASVVRALQNELSLSHAVKETLAAFRSVVVAPAALETRNLSKVLDVIDRTIQARQYLEAIQMISQAFEVPGLSSTQRATLFRYIGDCFAKLGDLDSGVENYGRAIELDPYCSTMYVGLGTISLQRHNYTLAVPQFQKAVSLAPNDDVASLGLGLAFEGLGEKRESLIWTARACHLNIENTAAIFNLVKLSYELEEFEDVERVLERYVALHPYDVNMTFSLGGVTFKLGKVDEAIRLMETILVIDPMNSRAHSLLNEISRTKNLDKRSDLRKHA